MFYKDNFFSILTSFSLLVFSSCIVKKGFISHKTINKKNIPVFIAFPQSKLITHNISACFHNSLVKRYKRVGYQLTNKGSQHYTLTTIITKFERPLRYVSPDILLFHSIASMEILATLFDSDHKKIASKTFSLSTLLSKPRNPIMNNSFIFSRLNKRLSSLNIRIEQYFRKHLFTTHSRK